MIGERLPPVDGQLKVSGALRYAGDVQLPGLLHARLVLAHEAHALVERIDAAAAAAVPGVVAVLTADDLPIVARGRARRFEPLARREVVFAGQPVAIVVAETEAAAEDAAELVELELTPLEPVLDLEAGCVRGSPRARHLPLDEPTSSDPLAPFPDSQEVDPAEGLSENVLGMAALSSGDVAAAFAQSDSVVSGRFRTGWVHQGHLEPQVALAWVEPDGELVLHGALQGPFSTQSQLADLFGLPLHQVRVRPAPIGGGFGAKFGVIEPLAAATALCVRRPVRLALTRSEDFAAMNPAPSSVLDVRMGARASGELTAIEARILVDRGANCEWGLEEQIASLLLGPYRWPAHEIRGFGVATNKVTFGAYRGPGGPPAAFARETLLDELAEALGLDPLELRLANSLRAGDVSPSGATYPDYGLEQCLSALREHPLWQGRASLPPGEGVGIGLAAWGIGVEPVAATCRLDADGGVTVIVGTADLSGTSTAFCQIAGEILGLPAAKVRVSTLDTSSAPHGGVTGGSKVTYTVGQAVASAGSGIRERLLEAASEELEIGVSDLELVDEHVRVRGSPQRALSLQELAVRGLVWGGRHRPFEETGGCAATGDAAISVAAHLAHVRVDEETGGIAVLGHVVAQDVGRAINPALVEGQMRGGVAQGLGWALYEELVHDEEGRLVNGSFAEYALPSAPEIPAIETVIVEVPSEHGPFGAKGAGEVPVLAVAGAVANAVASATGLRLRELPMTPERVWAATRGPRG